MIIVCSNYTASNAVSYYVHHQADVGVADLYYIVELRNFLGISATALSDTQQRAVLIIETHLVARASPVIVYAHGGDVPGGQSGGLVAEQLPPGPDAQVAGRSRTDDLAHEGAIIVAIGSRQQCQD